MKSHRKTIPFIPFGFVLFLSFLLGGCAATQWEPATVQMGQISWPPTPNAKVRYAGEIRAFVQTGTSLQTLIAGRSQSGTILKPVDVSTGPDNRLAIVDQDRKGVHFYNPVTKTYKLIALAGREKLETPVGVAFDDVGNIYVTDSKLRKILIFDSEGKFLHSISQANGLPLIRPTGITFNPFDNRIYVADTMRHQILVFSRLGQFISVFGQRGEEKGSLNFPSHIGSDQQGKIYITDSLNFRAQIVNHDLSGWHMFGRHGNGSGDFASPKGIAADTNGNIYIAETLFDNIQIFSPDGTYLLSIGSQGNGPGQFWMPSGLFINKDNFLYVCDTYNQRVQVFELFASSATQEAQTGATIQ